MNKKNIINLIFVLSLLGSFPFLIAGEDKKSVGVSPSELELRIESGQKIETIIYLSRSYTEGETNFAVSLREDSALIDFPQTEIAIPQGQQQAPCAITIDATGAKPGDYDNSILFTLQETYGQTGAVTQFQLAAKTRITVTKAPLNYSKTAMIASICLSAFIIFLSALLFKKRKVQH